MICKKAKIDPLDQQAKLQCHTTLAKKHTRSTAIPQRLPHRSNTGVGEDCRPTCSCLTLPKWCLSTFNSSGVDDDSDTAEIMLMIIYGDDDQNVMTYDGDDLGFLRMSLLMTNIMSGGDWQYWLLIVMIIMMVMMMTMMIINDVTMIS